VALALALAFHFIYHEMSRIFLVLSNKNNSSVQEVLFEEYRISSQDDDHIAFTVGLALLLRALKSSVSMDGEKLQVKLVKKRPIATERPMPYLTFESKVLFKQRT